MAAAIGDSRKAEKFDVVIAGGAVTGSVLALALSAATDHQIRLAIIEKQPQAVKNGEKNGEQKSEKTGGFDARSIALAQGSLQKLAQIQPLAGGNLCADIQPLATPIRQIHISDQRHFGKTTLCADELNLPQLGAVVELAKLGELLNQRLLAQPNIQLFCPDYIADLSRNLTACSLTLASGKRLETPLLVACDGIQSPLATQCGVATIQHRDYQQSAIIANLKISQPHQNQAFERFTPQGPFALLPLSEKTMSLVWCCENPKALLALPDAQFLQAAQKQFGWQLGKFTEVSQRFAYPLSSQQAQSHIHHRLAIVGNAAQLLHPVAGQGFNLGMRDLFTLATQVGKAFRQGEDLGGATLLHAFERQRQADQAQIIQATSGLISLFGCDFLPVQIARNAALITLSHCQPLRNALAHRAIGW